MTTYMLDDVTGERRGGTAVDVPLGQVDAVELCPRMSQRQRNEILAPGTAQLQHAALGHRARVKAEQPRQRGQAVRVRLDERYAGVRNGIVTVQGTSIRHEFSPVG